ncbi:MAG: hypothetical protein H7Y01_00980, partial [Ferruginibacter sp.]|nr:hypothetical protein [Chitinophagaceae bacterium]
MATGNWYKLSVKQAGIHKIDLAFLSSLGINTSNLASNSIRLFGNGGHMLAESNAGPWLDDLQENAITVVDGGDGVVNGNDYLLFYSTGPDKWLKDSVNLRFRHQKNIYSDKSFYFLSVGGPGKRIADAPVISSPNMVVTNFSERFFHELDTVTLLYSGKEWYGEEFSSLPGRSLTRNFPVNIPDISNGASLIIQSNFVARSLGAGSSFDVKVNNSSVGIVTLPPIGTGQFDLFAREGTAIATTIVSQSNPIITYTYTPGSFNAQGWLNWFEIFTRRNLSISGGTQVLFRDWASVGNNRAEFVVSNASASTQVWDVTDPLNPLKMQGNLTGGQFRFINDCSRLREYAA